MTALNPTAGMDCPSKKKIFQNYAHDICRRKIEQSLKKQIDKIKKLWWDAYFITFDKIILTNDLIMQYFVNFTKKKSTIRNKYILQKID